jgi:phosphoribosylformimino-5-aminoimidazole carboxamide ribotide isomerase
MGFSTLHIIDLDAALAMGDNRRTIQRVIQGTEAVVQVGGGIRNRTAIEETLGYGADRVIVGTRAIAEPKWLRSMAGAFPNQIIVAADMEDGELVTKGWTEPAGLPVLDFVRDLDPLPIAGILCTDVSREGRMEGIDLPGANAVIQSSRHPVWISGGITTLDELRALDRAGAVGTVLGMALYTGVLSTIDVAREFGT